MRKRLLTLALVTLMIPVKANAKVIDFGEFKLTAYCPCYSCSEGYGRNTASEKLAMSEHTVAADLSVFNIGDKITINGNEYHVEDCGGGVKGDHLDIFFDTHEEVEQFGVQYGDVKLLR